MFVRLGMTCCMLRRAELSAIADGRSSVFKVRHSQRTLRRSCEISSGRCRGVKRSFCSREAGQSGRGDRRSSA